MAKITLQALVKRYGDVEAVRTVDLDVGDGEITVLVGPSGCGKTTTLRLIAGLEPVTSGRILIDERDVTGLEPKDRDLAMVFQNYALYPHMTVADNIAFGLKARHVPRPEIERRVREAAELLDVGSLLKRKPGQLSGGQQQRVAIGRAIVRKPAAFLFDEPLSNLDAKLRVEMRTEILRLQRELRGTIVHVTHDQEEAMTLATRIAVMDKGIIRQIGTPTDIYEFPRTKFVADFIGSINQFEGEVKSSKKGMVTVSIPSAGVEMTVPHDRDMAPGAKVSVAVRPEKLKINRKAPAKGVNAVAGTVVDLGYFGKDSLYRVKLATGKLVSINSVNARRTGENERVAQWQDQVWLSFDPSSAIILTD